MNIHEISFNLLVFKTIRFFRYKFATILPTLKAKVTLKLLDCKYGKGFVVNGDVFLRPNGKNSIKLGNNVKFTARFLSNSVGLTNPIMLECIKNGRIEIGDNSGISSAILSSRKSIIIGKNVNIGGNVRIFDHDFHSTNYTDRRNSENDFNKVKCASVTIEDDVLIGTNVIILKGVYIGARSIIAAGSVVSAKYIPPDSLVAGNPAVIKEIKT